MNMNRTIIVAIGLAGLWSLFNATFLKLVCVQEYC